MLSRSGVPCWWPGGHGPPTADALHQAGWRADLVLQMPRKLYQSELAKLSSCPSHLKLRDRRQLLSIKALVSKKNAKAETSQPGLARSARLTPETAVSATDFWIGFLTPFWAPLGWIFQKAH